MQDFIKVSEVSERLKVNPDTVKKWIKEGHLPGSRYIDAGWRIVVDELEEFLESHAPPVFRGAKGGLSTDADSAQAGQDAHRL